MRWEPTEIAGAWIFTPTVHEDDRGLFLESYTAASLREATGFDLNVAQINISQSHKGVLRGLHTCRYPPGQAKYVQCVSGSVFDVIVDIRPHSATFGRFVGVELDDADRRAVFVSDGLAHGFCVRSESATVVYATSSPYDRDAEFAIHPLDPDLGIPWAPGAELVLSDRDSRAPSLREALSTGVIVK